MTVAVGPDDPRTPDVLRLLAAHLALMRASSPPCAVHALDLDGLLDPAVTVVSARRDGALLGVGALKQLTAEHAELKSMHVAAAARGQGVGRRVLDHLIDLARARGVVRVSLETGTQDVFGPARDLYAAAGFEPCPPFDGYAPSVHSAFFTRLL